MLKLRAAVIVEGDSVSLCYKLDCSDNNLNLSRCDKAPLGLCSKHVSCLLSATTGCLGQFYCTGLHVYECSNKNIPVLGNMKTEVHS